ncbi:MAG: hypothetical protein NVSMB66_4100 [Candidatus Doudnabacteria bacterium]
MPKEILKTKYNDQKGVTLLLSILILAAMSAIVFSVGAIALNEIRSSGDLTKSEPVIKANEAFAEDSLFKTLRGLSTLASCSSASTVALNGVNVSTCVSYYYASPYSFNMTINARKDFYLYNPLDQTANPGYTGLSVRIIAGSTGTVYFCTFVVADCVSTPTSSLVLSVNGPTTWNSGPLDTTQKYQLILINGAGSAATYSISSAPNGLPAGTTTIINQGSKQGVTRKLQTQVPQ